MERERRGKKTDENKRQMKENICRNSKVESFPVKSRITYRDGRAEFPYRWQGG